MPGLADTTVRLLGQEPLAGRLPTAEQLRIAEVLDGAGFAYLEVSGGGCFESAVRRGVVPFGMRARPAPQPGAQLLHVHPPNLTSLRR